MTRIHHCSVIQNSVTALEVPCLKPLLLIHLSVPSRPPYLPCSQDNNVRLPPWTEIKVPHIFRQLAPPQDLGWRTTQTLLNLHQPWQEICSAYSLESSTRGWEEVVSLGSESCEESSWQAGRFNFLLSSLREFPKKWQDSRNDFPLILMTHASGSSPSPLMERFCRCNFSGATMCLMK